MFDIIKLFHYIHLLAANNLVPDNSIIMLVAKHPIIPALFSQNLCPIIMLA